VSTQTTKRKVPSSALEFRLPCEFVAEAKPDPLRGPVKLTARSGEPIDHWYWGRIVHDMAGMVHKPRVALDWCHDQDEPIGYADTFDISSGDLQIGGEIIATDDEDRAAMVLAKGRAGVPFEASIKFGHQDLALEEIPKGFTAEVNGRSIEGPVIVARHWNLRGVAVCLYGYDPNTKTSFAADGDREVELTILQTKGTGIMPNGKTNDQALTELTEGQEAKPQTDQGELAAGQTETQKPPEQAAWKVQLADYTTRFGGELGAKWLTEDKPLVDAYAEFVAMLATEHSAELAAVEGKLTAAEEKVGELERKIAQLGELAAGEGQPLSSNPAGAGERAEGELSEKAKKLAETKPVGLAKFAAGLRLPKERAAKQEKATE
jgi:hypothetical protein